MKNECRCFEPANAKAAEPTAHEWMVILSSGQGEFVFVHAESYKMTANTNGPLFHEFYNGQELVARFNVGSALGVKRV